MSTRVDAFVVVAPGLEPLVLDEVVRLGIRPARAVRGGVACTVTWRQVWSLNLRLRMATRVLVRISAFAADGPGTLDAGLRRIDWAAWLPAEPVEVRATCDAASGLFHSGAVEQRVRDSIARAGGTQLSGTSPSGTQFSGTAASGPAAMDAATHDADADHAAAARQPQVVHVRVDANRVTVSIDASGRPLYQRGWRGAAGRAPMRETLAAALLAASGWQPTAPLVDPFCGSGTVLIEAAMAARRLAPGRHRSFAAEHWPSFDEAAWRRIVAGVDADVIERCPPIAGSDRDEGAVAAARDNARRAGVAGDVEVRHAAISDVVPPPGGRRGWLVSNPPYGERVSGGRSLVPLYGALGGVLRDSFASWHWALLAAQSVPLQATGIEWTEALRTSNGGIPVRVMVAGPASASAAHGSGTA
ncbi:MAG: class I SAM-dependent RNA methyltransferase [Ilumatobacteraceae bacterium]